MFVAAPRCAGLMVSHDSVTIEVVFIAPIDRAGNAATNLLVEH
jgi:hypothetical protein